MLSAGVLVMEEGSMEGVLVGDVATRAFDAVDVDDVDVETAPGPSSGFLPPQMY